LGGKETIGLLDANLNDSFTSHFSAHETNSKGISPFPAPTPVFEKKLLASVKACRHAPAPQLQTDLGTGQLLGPNWS
jgi:hypothetical protein